MYMILGKTYSGRLYELNGQFTLEKANAIMEMIERKHRAKGNFIYLFLTPVLDA